MAETEKKKAGVETGSERPPTAEDVLAALWPVFDPELNMSVVDLGLIYDVRVENGVAKIRMTLTSPHCPEGPYLVREVRNTARGVPGIRQAEVELVWDPPWTPERMTEECRLELGFDV